MTSPDGINWTSRISAVDNEWRSICYGNGLFVVVSSSGTGNRVMTSSKQEISFNYNNNQKNGEQTFTDTVNAQKGILVSDATKETNGDDAISIAQGTDPTTSAADQISIFATSGANCTLGLRTEASVVTETVTSDRTLSIVVNGVSYKLCLKS